MTGETRKLTAEPGAAPGLARRAAGGRPINVWRLEWRRLYRTPRAIALGVVFLAIGLIEPVVTKYENRLFAHVGNGVRITAPPPTPADALNSYASEVFLIGLILVVVLAAGPFTFDSSPGLSTFLRTRVTNFWQLLGPRFTLSAAAAAVAYLLGTVAAWYETRLLIGSLPAGAVFGGVLCGAVYLAFAVAADRTRGFAGSGQARHCRDRAGTAAGAAGGGPAVRYSRAVAAERAGERSGRLGRRVGAVVALPSGYRCEHRGRRGRAGAGRDAAAAPRGLAEE